MFHTSLRSVEPHALMALPIQVAKDDDEYDGSEHLFIELSGVASPKCIGDIFYHARREVV